MKKTKVSTLDIPLNRLNSLSVTDESYEETFLSNNHRDIYIDYTQYKQNPFQKNSKKYIPPEQRFVDNIIKTSKYTYKNFIFKNLFQQFCRISNIYFLIISIIQLVSISLSHTHHYATIIPLVLILLFSMIQDFYEDLQRMKSDNLVNYSKVRVLDKTRPLFLEKDWKDIQVGDIIILRKNHNVPADILLISTSESSGYCFVETANLDGETNLKIKRCIEPFHNEELGKSQRLHKLKCNISYDNPSKDMYKFEGYFRFATGRLPINIDINNAIWRGCTIRNTKWIVGIVLYTGFDTKYAQNSPHTPFKRSVLDKYINYYVAILLAFLLALSTISAFLSSYWMKEHDNMWYIPLTTQTESLNALNWVTFLILYNHIIPISLYLTIEIVKLFQTYFIQNDINIFHPPIWPTNVRSSYLNENLGLIDYIFTDKTGTLTCNHMSFIGCAVDGKIYGDFKNLDPNMHETPEQIIEEDEDVEEANDTNDNFESIILQRRRRSTVSYQFKDFEFQNAIKKNLPKTRDFCLCMALCHTVHVEINDNQINYQASSPDEEALIDASKNLGYNFVARRNNEIDLEINNEINTFQILNINDFTSDRKLMSIVVRDPQGHLFLLAKGADDVILDKLRDDQAVQKDVLFEQTCNFASQGFRTLCMAKRDLDEKWYDDWNQKYINAQTSILDRQKKLLNLAKLIETDLEILGASAIEDRLQQNVPNTITNLASAGCKIWMVTGDKLETAVNIAFSSKILSNEYDILRIDESSYERTLSLLTNYVQEYRSFIGQTLNCLALIINGTSLTHILNNKETDNPRHLFLLLCGMCQSVVACRLTPMQKAQLIRFVKYEIPTKPITLAIGDGANDIAMLKEAHVGVGVIGQEGMQAIHSSDYVLGQFHFLNRLLLVHGQFSYKRISTTILYSFYKNITYVLLLFYYGWYTGFSGTPLFDSWLNAGWNLIWTLIPVIIYGIFEQEVIPRTLLINPLIYKYNKENTQISPKKLITWLSSSLIHSIIVFHTCIRMVDIDDYYYLSIVINLCILIVVTIKIAFWSNSWTFFTFFGIIFSLGLWISFMFIISSLPYFSPQYYNLGMQYLTTPKYWLIIIFVVTVTSILDILFHYIQRTFFATKLQILQEKQKEIINDKLYNKNNVEIPSELLDFSSVFPESDEQLTSTLPKHFDSNLLNSLTKIMPGIALLNNRKASHANIMNYTRKRRTSSKIKKGIKPSLVLRRPRSNSRVLAKAEHIRPRCLSKESFSSHSPRHSKSQSTSRINYALEYVNDVLYSSNAKNYAKSNEEILNPKTDVLSTHWLTLHFQGPINSKILENDYLINYKNIYFRYARFSSLIIYIMVISYMICSIFYGFTNVTLQILIIAFFSLSVFIIFTGFFKKFLSHILFMFFFISSIVTTFLISVDGSMIVSLFALSCFVILRYKFLHSLIIIICQTIFYNIYIIFFSKLNGLEILQINFSYFAVLIFAGHTGYLIENAFRVEYLLRRRLLQKQQEAHKVLKQLLPPHITRMITTKFFNTDREIIASHEKCISVLFCDVISLHTFLTERSAVDAILMLDSLYSLFDILCQEMFVHKMETVGKTYMVCCGLPGTRVDHALALVELGEKMIYLLSPKKSNRKKIKNTNVIIRIGINSGEVYTGIVGVIRPQFCLFGDTVNVASRMQSTGEPQRIHISKSTKELLGNTYVFEGRQTLVKGKGTLETYLIGDCLIQYQRRRNKHHNIRPLDEDTLNEVNRVADTLISSYDNQNHKLIKYHPITLRFLEALEIQLIDQHFSPRSESVSSHVKSIHANTNTPDQLEKLYQYYSNSRIHGMLRIPLYIIIFYFLFLPLFEWLPAFNIGTSNFTENNNIVLRCMGVMLLRYLYVFLAIFLLYKAENPRIIRNIRYIVIIFYTIGYIITISIPLVLKLGTTSQRIFNQTYIFFIIVSSSSSLRITDIIFSNFFSLTLYLINLLIFNNTLSYDEFFFICASIILTLIAAYFKEIYQRNEFFYNLRLDRERENSDDILYTMLPPPVVREVKTGNFIANEFHNVAILYSDIVGFTSFASNNKADTVVRLLHNLFSDFDHMTRKHYSYKVQTIGDAYVVVSGFPFASSNISDDSSEHASNAIELAFDMHRTANFRDVQLRIGIHMGYVIAGCVGEKSLRYDIWGADCLVANILESNCIPGKILISKTLTWYLKHKYRLKPYKDIDVKGRGSVSTFLMNLPEFEDFSIDLDDINVGHDGDNSINFSPRDPLPTSPPIPSPTVPPFITITNEEDKIIDNKDYFTDTNYSDSDSSNSHEYKAETD